MECGEVTGRDAGDDSLEDLINTPLEPSLVLSPCGSEDSSESNSRGSSSSSGNFQSVSEQEENPLNTSASRGTQCCLVKSVAVQCDTTLLVTQGVQYESPLWVTQNVQCEPVSQVTLGVQCEPVLQVSQGVQCEPILNVSQNIQYESPSPVQKLRDALLEGKLSQASENKPGISTSVSINTESISSSNLQWSSSDQHFATGFSITLPRLQEELDVVTSSQTMVCLSSSSSSASEDTQNTVVREVPDKFSVDCSSTDEADSNSTIELITSDVSRKVKGKKCINKKNNRKGLVNYDMSNPFSKHKNSGREYPTSSRKCDKSDGEYTVEELILEMATNRKYAESEDEQDKVKSSESKKRQITAQKIFDTSKCHLSLSSRCDESLVKECSGDVIHGRNAGGTSEDVSSNKNETIDNEEVRKHDVQKIFGPPATQPEASRDVLPSSQTSTGGLQWFSSLLCERCSSPESIGEEACEELRGARSYCYRNIDSNVQSKDTNDLCDGSISCQNVRSSGSMKSDGRKSVTNYYIDSYKSPCQKRKKLCCDSNAADVIVVSPKFGGRLVPYSDSRSNSGSSDSEGTLELSKRMEQKRRKQTTHTSSRSPVQKGVKYRFKQTQESPAKVQRSSVRVTRSNSGSGSVRERVASFSISDSDSSTPEHNEVRMKVIQSKPESPVNSASIKIRRNNTVNTKSNSGSESVKTRSACLDIWTSDDDDDDDDDISSRMNKVSSCYSSESKCRSRPRAPYTKLERETILWSIIDHKCYKRVKGNAIWQRMEKHNVCPGRTWQSMKEHFIKKMLPQIETFRLDPNIIKKFDSMR